MIRRAVLPALVLAGVLASAAPGAQAASSSTRNACLVKVPAFSTKTCTQTREGRPGYHLMVFSATASGADASSRVCASWSPTEQIAVATLVVPYDCGPGTAVISGTAAITAYPVLRNATAKAHWIRAVWFCTNPLSAATGC